ncbi:succinate dehydrogenase, hydrophobic membrane anchor protein [Microvirga sp. W0021]|uniref:Succinate dehydrogenase hydrophobic membrane anchor subunit n=1 Tax=Hohaiivirga grylli TaxID=3133970 RepID=A0ABV0BKM4_9HYPH
MANDVKSAGPRFSVFGPSGKTLGKAVHGSKHWWTQRILTIIGLPLVIFCIFVFAYAAGKGPGGMVAILSKPWITILLGLTCFLMIAHMRYGLQQILEDYVPTKKVRYTMLVFNDAFCAVVAIMIAYAMVRLILFSMMLQTITY